MSQTTVTNQQMLERAKTEIEAQTNLTVLIQGAYASVKGVLFSCDKGVYTTPFALDYKARQILKDINAGELF